MKARNIIITILALLICGVSCFFLGKLTTPKEKCVDVKVNNNDNKEDEPTGENQNKKDLINHKFTRTYNINHIADSHDYDYIYITIREFQGEEIETVRVERSTFENIKVGDNWEITFKITSNEIEDNMKSIFKNSVIEKAVKTDKEGLEQIFENIE